MSATANPATHSTAQPASTLSAKRIGMITPSSNTALEPITYRLLNGREDVSVHFARVRVTRISLDEGADSQFGSTPMAAAAQQLADAQVDALVWAGTAGSWLGLDHDQDLVVALEQAGGGCRATTSTFAMIEACRASGVARLGLVTPYTADVNERVRAVYGAQGIDVVLESHLGITDNEAFARVSTDTIAHQLTEVSHGVDAVAVLCTNVRGAAVPEHVIRDLGVPVLDSVAVTLWWSLAIAGAPTRLAHI